MDVLMIEICVRIVRHRAQTNRAQRTDDDRQKWMLDFVGRATRSRADKHLAMPHGEAEGAA